jgi:hypothetical protein
MVDLLHPQEFAPEAPVVVAPPAPSPAPTPAPPVIAPPVLPPVPAPAPVAQTPSVNQIGTTQQPRLKKAFPIKKVIIGVLALLVLGGLGVGGYIFFGKSATPKPVAKVDITAGPVSQLAQSSGTSLLAAGAATNQGTLNLTFDLATSANIGSGVPEVEVQPLGTAFKNEATTSGTAVVATGHTLHLAVPATGFKDGSYHWQARIKVGDTAGAWSAFSADLVSFIVDTSAPAAPVLSTVGGTKSNGTAVTTVTQKPVFAGTAEANTKIMLAVAPEGISYTSTTSADGNWTITPTDDLPNGDHQVTVTATDSAGNTSHTDIKVSVNPVPTAVAAAPSQSPAPISSSTPTPSPTTAPTLAPTGDPVVPISFLALMILALSTLGLYGLSRRNEG